MRGVHLLLIDPQNDFADQKDGSLAVPGADKDMERIADFIEKQVKFLDAVHVTLDSHQFYHIANPLYWRNDNGDQPAPFTQITVDDVECMKWYPAYDSKNETIKYLLELTRGGRYQHTIWPPHCIIGELGHGIYPVVASAVRKWAEASVKYLDDARIDYILKGSNSHTEHFSAIRAEVPKDDDPSTQLNQKLIDSLDEARVVLVAGIAGSHCVANTVRDLVNNMKTSPKKKLVILKDTISPVPGCELLQEKFFKEMVDRGASITTTTEYIR